MPLPWFTALRRRRARRQALDAVRAWQESSRAQVAEHNEAVRRILEQARDLPGEWQR